MKKILSVFFVVVMIVVCMPLSLTAATTPVITIDNVNAVPGQEVAVSVNIKENPGIYGAIITFAFPTELTLMDVQVGNAFENLDVSLPFTFASPYTIFCDGLDFPADSDGTIVTFTFKVSEQVSPNKTLAVTATYLEGDVVDANFNDLQLSIQSGGVTVAKDDPFTYGDINSDGYVNIRDIALLQQYLAGWDVTISQVASDVNGDKSVNIRDLALLQQYLAGWDVKFPSHSSPATYAVEFRDYDGAVLKKETVLAGQGATAPADPYRAGYVFAGWDKPYSSITADIVVTAQYHKISGPTLIVESLTASPGETVTVDISIVDNPGLFGAIITYEFDSALTLKDAQAGSAFNELDVSFPPFGTPFIVFSDGIDEPAMSDGVIMTLTFEIPNDATSGQTFTINASHLEGDVVDSNFADVMLSTVSGVITVK